MAIVLRDLTVRHSRTAVAQAASVEPTYFSKLFRDTVGLTFRDWNKTIRVAAAQTLLRTSDRQIRDIAAAVGYADLTTFERVFRKTTGMRPREYRVEELSATPNAKKISLNAENLTPNADRVTRSLP
jgi:transcriptional regulator GlxA family with amidase domain